MSSNLKTSRDRLIEFDDSISRRENNVALGKELLERQTAKLLEAVENLQRMEAEKVEILRALAETESIKQELNYKIVELTEGVNDKLHRLDTTKKKELENSACKIGNLIGGIVICALIATGVVIIVLKQTHTI